MKKQLLLLILTLVPFMAYADNSGKCGDNVTYTFKEDTHTLTISGEGKMWDYDNRDNVSPWKGYGKTIQHLTIEQGITSIGNSAFRSCSGLPSVTIPNSVTSIGDYAFYECSGLTSVAIPNSVTSIGNGAFMDCPGLTSVTIPNSVTSIGNGAFHNCSSLTSVTIPNSVTSIGNGAFQYCSNLTSVAIPNSVTSIGNFAFRSCSGLTSVTIPNSVTSIGEYAFQGCSRLPSVTIPNSVTSIGSWAFAKCSSLTSVTIPNSVTSIGNGAFSECYVLTSVAIPNSVASIGDNTFESCSGLTSVTIPNSVTSIGISSFRGCYGLTSVTIPNSVTSIEQQAFEACSGLITITLPEDLQIIKKSTFKDCRSLKEIIIPSKVEFIYQEAFAGCSGLESVKVLAETPPFAYDNTFSNYNITLYVPKASVNTYQATNPWSKFLSFKTLTGGDVEVKVCAKPTISYTNGKLTFNCETEGATCQYAISNSDNKSGTGLEVSLSVTYNISVVATKPGFQNSETATATLCWIDVDPKTEGITDGVVSVRAQAVIIQNNGNVLNISGAPEGSMISVYDLSGQMVGSAKAGSETTNISTSLHSGEIGIVKIGDKAVKIILR